MVVYLLTRGGGLPALWDEDCGLPVNRQTPVKTLPCPILSMRSVTTERKTSLNLKLDQYQILRLTCDVHFHHVFQYFKS